MRAATATRKGLLCTGEPCQAPLPPLPALAPLASPLLAPPLLTLALPLELVLALLSLSCAKERAERGEISLVMEANTWSV